MSLVPGVPIELLDGSHTLVYGNRGLLALEDSGINLETAGDRRALTTLVWAGLLHEDRKRTLDDVVDLIEVQKYPELGEAVAKAMRLARGKEDDTPEGKPEATA